MIRLPPTGYKKAMAGSSGYRLLSGMISKPVGFVFPPHVDHEAFSAKP
jgi:hypothetical protein